MLEKKQDDNMEPLPYDMYAEWKEIEKYNEDFVKQFGPTAYDDFCEMIADCNVTDKIKFVDVPCGQKQDEDYGVFKDVHVDQYNHGCIEDSYAGYIYACVDGNWVSVYYEC